MIPIVQKIFITAIILAISIAMTLLDRAFPNLGLFNAHGGLALGMLIVYLLPVLAIFLMFAVPIAIWKLNKYSDSTQAHKWMITLISPLLLSFNLLLFFVSTSP